jgi:glycosyltransferase involved in cell wall biosynthesis
MKLGIFLNTPGFYKGGVYSFDYVNMIDFFATYASRVEELHLFVAIQAGQRQGAQTLDLGRSNLFIHRLPYYSDAASLVRRFPVVVSGAALTAARYVRQMDMVGAVVPSVVGNIFSMAAVGFRKPLFFIVRGDKEQGLHHTYKDSLAKWFFLPAFKIYNFVTERLMSPQRPIFTMGEDLQRKYAARGFNAAAVSPVLEDSFHLNSGATRWPEAGQPLRLLSVGRLAPEKGLDVLLRAIGILAEQGNSLIEITLVGAGPEESRLKQLADELNIRDRVQFSGLVPHDDALLAIYHNSHVYVHPSFTEGMPGAVLEAMGTFTPVIASAVGGIPGLISEGTTGFLVPPGDAPALADRITQVMHSPDLAAKAAIDAHKVAAAYTFSRQGQVLFEALCSSFPSVCS